MIPFWLGGSTCHPAVTRRCGLCPAYPLPLLGPLLLRSVRPVRPVACARVQRPISAIDSSRNRLRLHIEYHVSGKLDRFAVRVDEIFIAVADSTTLTTSTDTRIVNESKARAKRSGERALLSFSPTSISRLESAREAIGWSERMHASER